MIWGLLHVLLLLRLLGHSVHLRPKGRERRVLLWRRLLLGREGRVGIHGRRRKGKDVGERLGSDGRTKSKKLTRVRRGEILAHILLLLGWLVHGVGWDERLRGDAEIVKRSWRTARLIDLDRTVDRFVAGGQHFGHFRRGVGGGRRGMSVAHIVWSPT